METEASQTDQGCCSVGGKLRFTKDESTVGNLYTSCPLKKYLFLMSFPQLPLIKEKYTPSQTPPATLTAFYLI